MLVGSTKTLVSAVIGSLVLSIAVLRGETNADEQLTQQENTITICRISTIPSGYVIVGKATSEQCRQTSDIPERDNAWIIKKPVARETICEKSPYPNTYAITARVRSETCPGGSEENYNNAWVIERIK